MGGGQEGVADAAYRWDMMELRIKGIMHSALNWGTTGPHYASEPFDRIALNIKNKLCSAVHWLGNRKVENMRTRAFQQLTGVQM